MPIVTDNYKLSLTQDDRVIRIRCSQNDTSRQVKFTIYNNGMPFTIPSGLSASVRGIKQNGNIFSKSCSYSGSVVTLNLNSQITNVAGIAVAELVFTDSSGGKIGTSNFIFQVESDPLLKGKIDVTEETPTEYISDLVSMIEALSARVNNIIAPEGEASLSEVVDARLSGYSGETYPSLKARLDADFNEINNSVNELHEPIYSLTEQINYKKGLREDGYFHIQPVWFPGLYINSSGVESQSNVWVGSALIGVNEDDVITYSGERIDDVSFFVMILTYDSNKNFVSRIQNTTAQNNPYVVPENVKYIRFDLGYSTSQGMNRHPDIRLFDAYFSNSYINDVIVPSITNVQEKTNDLVFHVIGDEPSVEWENGTLDSQGRDYPNDNYARTDFLKTGKSVAVDNPNGYFLYICLFNANKQNIISLTRFYGEFETNDADYLRICVRTQSGTTGIDSVSIHINGMDDQIDELNDTIIEANEKINDLYIDNCITMLFATFKRFGVIGDSMAAGHLYPDPSTSANNYDDKQYAWGTFLTRFLGTTYYNFSQHGHDPKTFIEGRFPVWDSAGTTITGYTTVEDGNNFSTVIDGNHDVPLMFIAVGINNKFKLEMGSISDIDVNNPDNNADTRYGWYAKLVQKVSDYYANKNQPLIMVMLTFPFFSSASVTERYAPLVRDVYSTLKNSIEQNTDNRLMLIDLQADNSLYVSDFMMAQTIQNHYAGIGYNVAGMDLLRRLNRLIYNNPDIFERVDQIESNALITQYDNPENFT